MSQKKCVTIYGYSDDLVEIENSQYKEDEIDCYDKAIRFFFVDGTIISICYAQGGVWKITHEAIGKAWYELTRCEDDDDDACSDVFKIDSEIISYEVFTPKAKSIQDIQEQKQEKPEKLIPNHIRLIFFGFEDTLFISCADQRFGDDDIIAASLLQAEAKEQGSGYKVFDTIGKPNQLMREFVEEETDKIPKFCITLTADSIIPKFQKQWLDKYYPGKITDLVGTSSPERKMKTMQIIASAYGVPSNKVLFVDDKYDTVAQAIKHGFCAMTTIELTPPTIEIVGFPSLHFVKKCSTHILQRKPQPQHRTETPKDGSFWTISMTCLRSLRRCLLDIRNSRILFSTMTIKHLHLRVSQILNSNRSVQNDKRKRNGTERF